MTPLDVGTALAAALLALLLPGYFWAQALFPTLGWAERITFALGLSLALVPAAALLLTAVFRTNLNLPVAAAAVIIPAASGFALHLKLEQPPIREFHPDWMLPALDRTALIPLGIGAALMMFPILTRAPESLVAAPIVLLMFLTALFQALRRRSSKLPERSFSREEENGCVEKANDRWGGPHVGRRQHSPLGWLWCIRRAPTARSLLFPILWLLVLMRGYIGPVRHDWPYIRGADQYVHAIMTDMVLARGSAESYLIYPPGFHYLGAILSRLSGLQPLELYAILAPALLLLPALACYVLARRLFGPECGVMAALFAGLILPSSARFLGDGTYVDIVAAEFLLVLTVVALAMLLQEPSIRGVFLLATLGSSIVLYHTISTLYLGLVLALASVALLPYVLYRDRRRAVTMALSFLLLLILSIGYAWDTYKLGDTVGAILGRSEASETVRYASRIGVQSPLRLLTMPAYLSYPIVCFGFLGLLLLLGNLRRMRWLDAAAVLLLIGWACMFFAASRGTFSTFPWRFTRDLGVPLSVLAAFAVVSVLRSLDPHSRTSVVVSALVTFVVAAQAQQSLAVAGRPSRLLLPTPAIHAAGEWLRAHNEGGNIIVSAHEDQTSGNAMLAMGGYSGLTSFPFGVGTSRQLPTQHHQAVRDSREVLRRPGGRLARQRILRQQDIRYVVLYKNFRPGSVWYGKNPIDPDVFERRPLLYRPAYENEDVVIFRVIRDGD